MGLLGSSRRNASGKKLEFNRRYRALIKSGYKKDYALRLAYKNDMFRLIPLGFPFYSMPISKPALKKVESVISSRHSVAKVLLARRKRTAR